MTKVNIAPLVELLERDIEPEHLKSRLDDISYRYARLALNDPDACGGQEDEANDLYYLRMIREAVAAVMVLPECK